MDAEAIITAIRFTLLSKHDKEEVASLAGLIKEIYDNTELNTITKE